MPGLDSSALLTTYKTTYILDPLGLVLAAEVVADSAPLDWSRSEPATTEGSAIPSALS